MKYEKNPCIDCGCWDSDAEGCTMPSVDRSYACSLENNVPLEIKGKKELEFFMAMLPPTKTHQEKQVHVVKGKPCFYEPDELKAARAKLEAHLSGHVPEKPFGGAVRLVVKWCFSISGKHSDGEYKTSKPDTDNLQKMLKDVMTKLHFWKDDAQVASEITEKFWAAKPGIYVRIEEL